MIVRFAVVQRVAQLMRVRQFRIVQPDTTTGLVTLKFGVACARISLMVQFTRCLACLTVVQVGQKGRY